MATIKRFTIHTVGGDRFDIDASGFTINSKDGTIEFSDAKEHGAIYTVFLHGVAYIEEFLPVDKSKLLPQKYGSSRP
jgi:hypothetical protein